MSTLSGVSVHPVASINEMSYEPGQLVCTEHGTATVTMVTRGNTIDGRGIEVTLHAKLRDGRRIKRKFTLAAVTATDWLEES